MVLRILCVGKLKERYYKEAVNEYLKRIGRFADIEVEEVLDEKIPESFSEAEERIAVEKEGKRILARLTERDHVIVLRIDGKRYDSVCFAEHFKRLIEEGNRRIVFVIGGSAGVSEEIMKRGNEGLSLSDMTFPHRIARLLLVEQIYRSFKIINHETYHK